MRAVVQRVTHASVDVGEERISQIKNGLFVLLGITDDDTEEDIDYILKKITGLRIFDDKDGIMNININDSKGELLIVSQFTLYGDARKGNRPSYIKAAKPEIALPIYSRLLEKLKDTNVPFKIGEFGADMKVNLTNDGPVTILLDSERRF